MKLWGGRFQKSTDTKVNDFNSSISFDCRLYKQDIAGSIAHARMLGAQNIITLDEAEAICRSLEQISDEIESGSMQFDPEAEDIHTFVENTLISRIGNTGRKLHTGRSRNDQVALDLRIYTKEQIVSIREMLMELEQTLINIAEANVESIMPGYTHLQKAQPITFAHHLMAYFQMFRRDIERLDDAYKRTDFMPLGSGALAATTYPLDRTMVAKELGFSAISENSLDGVSDRDFAIELLFCISLVMLHLSRFSEELVLWSSSEFGFIEMDDSFSTGSSIMPQKKNPDVAELVRGKSGRAFGNLTALLTIMKGLPLAYNKDMQEDKEALFDSVDTVKLCLPVFTGMISTMKLNIERMRAAAKGGFTNATDLADYLVKKGLPFRTAHKITGQVVLHCINQKCNIQDLAIDELKQFSVLFEIDIYDALSIEACVQGRNITGGPSPETVKASIKNGKDFISKR